VNALTGRSSSVGVISTGRSATTSPTTTRSGRTGGSTCGRLTRRRIPPHRFPACCVCEEATSWVASSMSTNWSPDAESRVSVPFSRPNRLGCTGSRSHGAFRREVTIRGRYPDGGRSRIRLASTIE
jgi:hypothetical protein